MHTSDRPTLGRVARTLAVLALIATVVVASGCKRERSYDQSTPDDVVKSAVAMVKQGEARRLASLIYVESPEMRQFLGQLGVFLGNLQKLSAAVAKRWPDEYAKMQAQAAEKAKSGSSQILGMFAQGQRRRGNQASQQQQGSEAIRDAFNALLADPYGWIESNVSRITTVKASDDAASVMIDNQPAIPIIGLQMKKEADRWYVVLPTNAPGVSNVWPKTKAQWQILGSLVVTMNNAAVDLTRGVEDGNVASMEDLLSSFQERALIPAAMVMGAYGRELDVVSRMDRRLRLFSTRLRDWAKKREERLGSDDAKAPVTSEKLLAVLRELATANVEKAVRSNTPTPFDTMPEVDFEEAMNGWMREANLAIKVDGDLTPGAVDAKVDAWRAEQRARATQPVKRTAREPRP